MLTVTFYLKDGHLLESVDNVIKSRTLADWVIFGQMLILFVVMMQNFFNYLLCLVSGELLQVESGNFHS